MIKEIIKKEWNKKELIINKKPSIWNCKTSKTASGFWIVSSFEIPLAIKTADQESGNLSTWWNEKYCKKWEKEMNISTPYTPYTIYSHQPPSTITNISHLIKQTHQIRRLYLDQLWHEWCVEHWRELKLIFGEMIGRCYSLILFLFFKKWKKRGQFNSIFQKPKKVEAADRIFWADSVIRSRIDLKVESLGGGGGGPDWPIYNNHHKHDLSCIFCIVYLYVLPLVVVGQSWRSRNREGVEEIDPFVELASWAAAVVGWNMGWVEDEGG